MTSDCKYGDPTCPCQDIESVTAALARAEELGWKLQDDSAITEAVQAETDACANLARMAAKSAFDCGVEQPQDADLAQLGINISDMIAKAIEARGKD